MLPTPDDAAVDDTTAAPNPAAIHDPAVIDVPSAADRTDALVAHHAQILDTLANRPLHERADTYAAMHSELQAALDEIDSA